MRKLWSRRGLAVQVAVFVALALATNGLIFALGWRQPDRDIQPSWAPPGYVVGIVWTVLFGTMGAARWLALKSDDPNGARLIVVLVVLCLAYPFYTLGFQDRMPGLAGILVTFALTAAIAFRARRRGCRAGLMLLPLLGWLCFATALVLRVAQLNA